MAWRLVVARHSLAYPNHAKGDHERELTEDGIKLAGEFGQAIKSAGLKPSLVLSSSAVRAVRTADAALAAAGLSEIERRPERELFQCVHSSWINHLRSVDDSVGDLLAVGHAPTVGNLIGELSGRHVSMPACCAYLLEYEQPWRMLDTAQPGARLFFTSAS